MSGPVVFGHFLRIIELNAELSLKLLDELLVRNREERIYGERRNDGGTARRVRSDRGLLFREQFLKLLHHALRLCSLLGRRLGLNGVGNGGLLERF